MLAWCLLLPITLAPARADLSADLIGSWSGYGWIKLANGNRERLKCSVGYEGRAGGQINETLRCNSASYRLNGTGWLVFDGASITGTWSERNFGVAGSLSGQAGGGGMALTLSSATFTADLTARVSRCTHSIDIAVSSSVISAISVSLSRC